MKDKLIAVFFLLREIFQRFCYCVLDSLKETLTSALMPVTWHSGTLKSAAVLLIHEGLTMYVFRKCVQLELSLLTLLL